MSPTTEEQEALALRRWLEHPSWPPPEDVDLDVAEAVYALRPELAPGPTATIEEILATVHQAGDVEKLLAGEDADLDDDVAEAIYALRPDKAPGPTIRIESILERVTEGPLAAGAPANAPVDVGGEVVPFPGRPAHVAPEVQPANEPLGRTMQTMARTRAEERARSRWFPLVASGSALLVAALAAIVITPRILGGAQDAAPEPTTPTEQVAAAPMSAPMTDAPADRLAAKTAEPARMDAPAAAHEGAATPTPAAPPAIPEVVAQLDKQQAQQPFTEVGGLDGYEGGEGSGASGARFRDDSVAMAPAKDVAPTAPKATTARPATVDAKVPADADGDVVADLGDDEEKPADEYWSNLQGSTGGSGAPVGAFGGTVATGSAPPPTAQAARPSAGDELAEDDDMTRGADAPLELARESKKDEKEKVASKPREPRRGTAGPAASNELQPTFDQVAAAEAPPPPPPAEPAVVADASAHATSTGTATTGTVASTETATTSSTTSSTTPAGRAEAKTKSAPTSRASAWAIPVSAPSLDALSADARDRATSLDAQASALAAQGRYHDAATTLTPAISAPAAVGEWYAARVAQYYLSAGETTSALDACRLGLSLGTPQTALLRVYGDVLAATGDTAGAERAYQQAVAARGASGRSYAPTASPPRSTTSEAK